MEQEWWRTAVVYQVWPRSFADSDDDGIGDLRGVISKLDHLSDLGIDALWLSPFYPSPQVDAGYDISDYQGVDPLFGTLQDVDDLIAGLHARGIRLVLDMVLNHTSDQHPWFVESRSDTDNPKRDWYFWFEERPNSWPSLFGGDAWELDERTGEYYLHTFAKEQADLDWRNPQVRQALAEMLRWWLDRGVDGFRLDVISMISKDIENPWGFLGFGPQLHEFLQELHREAFAGRGLMTVGETPMASVEQARLMSAPDRRELDMVFGFEHVSLDHNLTKWDPVPLSLPTLKQSFARWQQGLGNGWNSLYWDNHDQPRAVSRFGDDGEHRVASAKTLATVLHLHRGTPFVYQGEELGMKNAGFAGIEDYRDLESLNWYRESDLPEAEKLALLRRASRDNARTPMPWDDSRAASWIGYADDTVTVAAQRSDPDSVLAHYRKLIALRHEIPAVAHGDFALLLPDDERIWAFTRTYEGVELLVVANFSSYEVDPGLPDDGELLIGSAGPLRAWESRVTRRAARSRDPARA
jgi:oligo-1,6-glucosidase